MSTNEFWGVPTGAVDAGGEKACLNCGSPASDEAESCATCGREFAFRGITETVEAASPAQWTRPDGKMMLGVGWASFCLGILSVLFSFEVNTTSFGEVDLAAVATRWNLMVGGAALTQIGFLLILTGTIVRAIWFLPGKDI